MPATKVLLVEDGKEITYVLRLRFKKEGYAFLSAKTAESGLRMMRKHNPDIIIMDIMLPRMSGLDMLAVLRRESQIPVLFLTAKQDETHRMVGFKLGADDYVSKPFSIPELLARVRAILNRVRPRERIEHHADIVRAGQIEMDDERHEVRVHGKFRKLTPREFQLLQLLMKADGKVLSRERLLKQIWGYDESMEISTRTVDQHVARLRRRLFSERGRLLTVKNLGYRLRTV